MKNFRVLIFFFISISFISNTNAQDNEPYYMVYGKDIISEKPLVIKHGTKVIKCSEATTTLEHNLCVASAAYLERKKLDSLNKRVLGIYDSLIVAQEKEMKELEKEEGIDTSFYYMTNYKLIKELHIKSLSKYLEYVELEREITGTKSGIGTGRPAFESYKVIELLEEKNKEFENFIQDSDY